MKTTYPYQYTEQEVPFRCRNPRGVLHQGSIVVNIREFKSSDLPVALIEHHAVWCGQGNRRRHVTRKYYYFRGKLWLNQWPAAHRSDDEKYKLEIPNPKKTVSWDNSWDSRSYKTQAERLQLIREYVRNTILIDGKAYRPVEEPRYYVFALGLGCNHSSSGIGVDYGYNSNRPWQWYFNIKHLDKAIAMATEVATKRGDTDSLPIKLSSLDPRFEILIPTALKVNPRRWGCKGDEFTNKIHALTNMKDPTAAGLLGMMMAFKGL